MGVYVETRGEIPGKIFQIQSSLLPCGVSSFSPSLSLRLSPICPTPFLSKPLVPRANSALSALAPPSPTRPRPCRKLRYGLWRVSLRLLLFVADFSLLCLRLSLSCDGNGIAERVRHKEVHLITFSFVLVWPSLHRNCTTKWSNQPDSSAGHVLGIKLRFDIVVQPERHCIPPWCVSSAALQWHTAICAVLLHWSELHGYLRQWILHDHYVRNNVHWGRRRQCSHLYLYCQPLGEAALDPWSPACWPDSPVNEYYQG